MTNTENLFFEPAVNPDQPIAIFDSGPGGLALLKYILEFIPSENILYLGDTARQPYGIQEKLVVRQYTLEACTYLQQNKAKIILIGCNTASVAGLEASRKAIRNLPILGMIDSGVEFVLRQPDDRRIGVWGTQLTINSHAYQGAIHKIKADMPVVEIACPELLRLAEKGDIKDRDQIIKLCQKYFNPLKSHGTTDLILGCTDLTCVRDEIEYVVGKDVNIIDPAEEIVYRTQHLLTNNDLLNPQDVSGRKISFHITGDGIEEFKSFVYQFLGLDAFEIRKITL